MADVVTLALIPKPKSVNKDAQQMVEDLLERVKSGETVDVAVVEVTNKGTVATAWSGAGFRHMLNSGAAVLAQRLAAECH